MTKGGQDKFAEAAFWDVVASQRVYAAFDEVEYNDLFDRAFGSDLTGKVIADIGSASGVSAALLAARGARVIGIEISPELVTQAQGLWQEYAERIDFQVGDAEHLAFDSESVDGVFFGGVLHHIPILDRTIAEALRVLKPGGVFVAIEPNRLDFIERIEWAVADFRGKLSPNEYPIDPNAMRGQLQQTGFQEVHFWTARHDIPFLAQFPVLRLFFSRQRGFAVKRPVLRVVDAFRAPECRGTFFVIVGLKPGGTR